MCEQLTTGIGSLGKQKQEAEMKPYYSKDGITIFNAKCEQVLPFLLPVDLLLTDPPYGIGVSSRGQWGTSKCGEVTKWEKSDWDDRPPAAWTIEQARSLATWQIIFGGNYFELPPSRCWLVWDKDNTGDFADCELAWTNLDKAVRKIRWRWNGMIQELGGDKKEPRLHPAQKPLAVVSWALSHAPDSVSTVLDPFMGSGTTLVAAKLAGKCAVGIEQSEEYCEAAVDRLRQGVLTLTG